MKKLFGIAGLIGLLLCGGAIAQLNGTAGNLNGVNVTNPFISAGNNGVAVFHPAGLLYTTVATASTATGTAEQTLGTYSLPANALDLAGRKLRIKAAFHAATNGNNKTFKLYFGASVISSGVLTTSNKNIVSDLIVTKSGASTQIVYGTMLADTTPITPYVNAGTDDDTAAIVIKATGTDGTSSAADIVLEDFSVEYWN